MAGYVCKIVIENTHPPVWRRIMIPERITFGELHEIIQIVFGWENAHLHEFVIPSEGIEIGSRDFGMMPDYFEEETLIDSFFQNYKWIRYIYDFGDDWKHKINIEKMDEEYTKRNAVLMKVKGDNFEEDSGGIWGIDEEENRITFDKEYVENLLEKMIFPMHDELAEAELSTLPNGGIRDVFDGEELKKILKEMIQQAQSRSAMQKKADEWDELMEDKDEWRLKILTSSNTQKDFLMTMGETEATDYYKYLRIPPANLDREEKISVISQVLKEHPEYMLYILNEDEYEELKKWMGSPSGTILKSYQNTDIMIKTLILGLGTYDYEQGNDIIEIKLASDIGEYIGVIDDRTKKRIYKKLHKFDERLAKLLQVYQLADLEGFYDIYTTIYKENIEKKDFFRLIYFHAAYNNLMETGHTQEGINYISAIGVDCDQVIAKLEHYGRNLSYKLYSKEEIDIMAENLGDRNEWIDEFFVVLHYQLDMELEDASECLCQAVGMIADGNTIDEIMKWLEFQIGYKISSDVSADLWKILAGLMLEFELPMLKGRNRWEYAEEKKCSPWSLDMLSEEKEKVQNTKEKHIYEFPLEIQECMNRSLQGNGESLIQYLLDYKEKNYICSEEYLYLLTGSCVLSGYDKKITKKLIAELKKSSVAGKRGAKRWESEMEECSFQEESVMPREFTISEDFDMLYGDADWIDEELPKEPYIRGNPKIGRNDPCPCGSGKKYKKCCGK